MKLIIVIAIFAILSFISSKRRSKKQVILSPYYFCRQFRFPQQCILHEPTCRWSIGLSECLPRNDWNIPYRMRSFPLVQRRPYGYGGYMPYTVTRPPVVSNISYSPSQIKRPVETITMPKKPEEDLLKKPIEGRSQTYSDLAPSITTPQSLQNPTPPRNPPTLVESPKSSPSPMQMPSTSPVPEKSSPLNVKAKRKRRYK